MGHARGAVTGPTASGSEGWDAFDMLDVSLLLASALMGRATEVSSAPASAAISVVQPRVQAPAAVSTMSTRPASISTGPVNDSGTGGRSTVAASAPHAVDPSRLSGVALLSGLGAQTPDRIAALLDSDPAIAARLIAHPPTAVDTAAAWSAMPAASRHAIERASPRLVGALEGIPYTTRDRANRVALADRIASLQSRLDAGAGRAVSADLRSRLHMLKQIRTALESDGGRHRELIAFDGSGQGRAIIGVGDVDHADYVGFLVPGMYYGVDARIVPWTGTAAAIASRQAAWLGAEAGAGHAARTSAVVAWIGYETPTLVDVASMADARRGGEALVKSLAGLRAARDGSQPYVSLLAHSYGATAAMLAASTGTTSVDALAVVGSPGSPVGRASELGVRDGNVWVGAAAWDPIAQSGVFGSQPTSAAYGAQAMGVAGGTDPDDGQRLVGTVSHNDYFAPGSETVRNFALIGIDADSSVLRPDGRTVAASGR